jgi:hypothetical protein
VKHTAWRTDLLQPRCTALQVISSQSILSAPHGGSCRAHSSVASTSRPAADPLQVDELFVTMVSVHSQGGWFKNDTEKAASAISLTTKVYRDYMDTIAKAHPEVHKA